MLVTSSRPDFSRFPAPLPNDGASPRLEPFLCFVALNSVHALANPTDTHKGISLGHDSLGEEPT